MFWCLMDLTCWMTASSQKNINYKIKHQILTTKVVLQIHYNPDQDQDVELKAQYHCEHSLRI